MVEVISLISSSPPEKSASRPRPVAGKGKARAKDSFALFDEALESVENSIYTIPSGSKRRKLGADGNGRTTEFDLDKDRSLSPSQFTVGLQSPEPRFDAIRDLRARESPELDVFDSITFSSSAPQPTTAKKATNLTLHDLSDDLPDDLFSNLPPCASQPSVPTASRSHVTARSANLAAKLKDEILKDIVNEASHSKASDKRLPRFQMIGASSAGATIIDDIFSSSPPLPLATKTRRSKLSEREKSPQTAKSTEARASERILKNAEKEAEKERKRHEREEKAREKQRANEIAEVNKKKTDKKASTREMIVDLPRQIQGTSVGNQFEEYMKLLEVEMNYCDEEIDLLMPNSSIAMYPGNMVKWRRKVEARYNANQGHWEPILKPTIEQENHILVYLTGVEFATIAGQPSSADITSPISEAAMKANLDEHIKHLHSQVRDSKPIYLIEGLDSWLRKNANAKNRAYTAAVRAQEESNSQIPPSTQPTRSKKRKKASSASQLDLSHFDFELMERLQLHLQLHALRPLIHLTVNPTNTATWLKSFTEHISTIPYRRLKLQDNLASASFCMESGQVKTGEDATDTYVKMLQEVQRVTPSMAYGIAGEYANVRALVEGFKNAGPLMLQDVRKSANKDGALSERRLGPQVSRRLHKVFMGMDPESVDGIS